jgi:2-methylisocitrate lyase-like PEP mutase family enzyme
MTDLDPQDRATPGQRLAEAIRRPGTLPCIGIYDVFSASIAGQHFDALFVSGFGLAASYYGLPDIGFIAWPDVASLVQRVRTVFPGHHILVDIDDGYCDPEVACHVVSVLEASGASGIVLEDQKRPRRCGHFEGKQIMDLDEYLAKLRQVLATRRDLVVVARTDTADPHDMERRVMAFADSGADAVLIDGIPDLDIVRRLAERIAVPFCFNQIAGGKSPPFTLGQLDAAGVALAIYSTPCLFAAQAAIEDAMVDLKNRDGTLEGNRIRVRDCTRVLEENLARRDSR